MFKAVVRKPHKACHYCQAAYPLATCLFCFVVVIIVHGKMFVNYFLTINIKKIIRIVSMGKSLPKLFC